MRLFCLGLCGVLVRADVNLLFDSVALAGVSNELQHAVRNISPGELQTLNCFSANRLGDYFQKIEEVVNLGIQQQRRQYNSVRFQDEWDRLLLGFLEVSNLYLDTECRSTRISPRLCESISKTVDHYIRQRLCGEVYDLDWIESRCPEDIIPGFSPPPSFSVLPLRTSVFPLSPSSRLRHNYDSNAGGQSSRTLAGFSVGLPADDKDSEVSHVTTTHQISERPLYVPLQNEDWKVEGDIQPRDLGSRFTEEDLIGLKEFDASFLTLLLRV